MSIVISTVLDPECVNYISDHRGYRNDHITEWNVLGCRYESTQKGYLGQSERVRKGFLDEVTWKATGE